MVPRYNVLGKLLSEESWRQEYRDMMPREKKKAVDSVVQTCHLDAATRQLSANSSWLPDAPGGKKAANLFHAVV